jgi:hypothetical protein
MDLEVEGKYNLNSPFTKIKVYIAKIEAINFFPDASLQF